MKNVFWFIILLVLGGILCYLAQDEWKRKNDLINNGDEVEATVVRLVHDKKMYYPLIAFTYKGRDYEVRANEGSKPAGREVGEKVIAIVNKLDPADLEIKSFFNQKGKPMLLGLFGIVCFTLAFKIVTGKVQ